MELYDVVKKLLGEIDPVGETNEDNRRFENLKATTDLVYKLLTDIGYVEDYFKDCHEYSKKKASKFASKFLEGVIEEYTSQK